MSATQAIAKKPTAAKPSSSASPGILLQRKCACGGSAGLTGECEECKEKKLLGKPLQKKLAITQAGDDDEREADRVADHVLCMPARETEPGVAEAPRAPLVQRRTPRTANTGSGDAPPIVHDVLASVGQPLDTATREYFEPRFGRDFSSVRIHSDARAAESARSVDALAYTVGDQIVSGAGHPWRHSEAGSRLLAHELSHVVQQSGADAGAPAGGHGLLQRIPMEGLPFRTELANEQMRQRDKERAGVEPRSVPWEEIKKAGFDWLIEQATALRESYIAGLRERASYLPAALQPAAQGFIGVVAADVRLLVDLVFFDLGLIVGLGEGIVQTVVGILHIIVKILEVAWHYVLATIFAVQQELSKLGLADYPNEELIAPLADDLMAAEQLWREFPAALATFLMDWANRFQQASQEQKAVMAGDFTADVLLFIGTWEFSATKIGRLRIPPIKIGPAPSAAPVVAFAGGGSAALETTVGLSIPGTSVGVGGPMGVGGAAVSRMAGRGREGESKPAWDDDPVGVLRQELGKAEKEVGELPDLRKQIDDLVNDTGGTFTEDSRFLATAIRQEILEAVMPRRVERLDELIRGGRAREAIEARGFSEAEKAENLAGDMKWLQHAGDEQKKLAYDPATNKYRVDEAQSILRFAREEIVWPPVTRSALEGYDYVDASTRHWSVKGNFQNRTSAKDITTDLMEEVVARRNLLADLDSAQIASELQAQVKATVEKITGWMKNKDADDFPASRADFENWARTKSSLDVSNKALADAVWDLLKRDATENLPTDYEVHFLTYRPGVETP
jgi:hypothetical protein